MDPPKADITKAAEPSPPTYCGKNTNVSPTHSFAPDEIPSTKGPAIGFLKKACKRNPETASAPPRTAARSILGSLIFKIILACADISTEAAGQKILFFAAFHTILMISPAGIYTEPRFILSANPRAKSAARTTAAAKNRPCNRLPTD